jgi:hypothetical protein
MRTKEKRITKRIISKTPNRLQQAVLYGVYKKGITLKYKKIASNENVYEMLWETQLEPDNKFIGFSIETTGWAAPLLPDGSVAIQPSLHPEKVRCAVVVTKTLDGFCSAVKMKNKIEYEDGSKGALPEGQLMEAIELFMKTH